MKNEQVYALKNFQAEALKKFFEEDEVLVEMPYTSQRIKTAITEAQERAFTAGWRAKEEQVTKIIQAKLEAKLKALEDLGG